jgi:two-component system chemotaxis response regulator CheY
MERKVLFIDDDEIHNFILSNFLEQIPEVQAKIMDDSQEALAWLKEQAAHAPDKLPSLLFLDLNMPGMDGFEFLAAMQEQLAAAHIPNVLILTSSVNSRDWAQARSYACVQDLMIKPLTLEKLQQAILATPVS